MFEIKRGRDGKRRCYTLTFSFTADEEGSLPYELMKGAVLAHEGKGAAMRPKRVVRNGDRLIVYWEDGAKTKVRARDEEFDVEKGLAMALLRRFWQPRDMRAAIAMVEDHTRRDERS